MFEKELSKLLAIRNTHVDALLKEYQHVGAAASSPERGMSFHYVRFQNGEPRLKDLVELLADLIIPFCLPRERRAKLTETNARRLYKEARDMFSKPKNQAHSGELGELLNYFLVEGRLNAPQIVSKMAMKSSGNMNVNGSDGIHLGERNGTLQFFYGESKVYKNLKSAVSDALNSISAFNFSKINGLRTQHDFEINVARNHLDIPHGPLRDAVLDMLDPYSNRRDEYTHAHACFIGFDWDVLKSLVEENSPQWATSYSTLASEIIDYLEGKIESDETVKKLRWHFFFVPFRDVDELRNTFSRELME